VSSRKQEKERLRAERQQAEKVAAERERRRTYLGYGLAAVITVIVVVGLVAVISGSGGDDEGTVASDVSGDNVNTAYGVLPEGIDVDDRVGTEPPPVANGDLVGAARTAGCDVRTNLPDEGSTHFSDIEKVPDYETAPPTSGDHYAANEAGSGALADGAFLQTPPLNRAVHSLEHGRVAIQYDPDLSEEDQLAIKGVFDEAPAGVLLFPNDDMPFDVAATAWTQLVGCGQFEAPGALDALRAFRDSYLGRGPEAVPFQ
jgi:hypothetical protein